MINQKTPTNQKIKSQKCNKRIREKIQSFSERKTRFQKKSDDWQKYQNKNSKIDLRLPCQKRQAEK
jgi:hypothetical protein